ncbi:hypothetical protein BAZOLSSOX_1184 [uncultured Gammaproteobacteria bacterium]|jgi:uncharacterized protein YegP (UPF0339 family)|nr:hypothetical protein [uncultured Gammaproteobacteria bacterium]VVH56468.1 hypothetical protein BAZOLSSOX_1184 [uncultured Gammaproteobacteria bacterium]
MSNGKFEIYKGSDNQYWFRLKTIKLVRRDNGNIYI